MADLAKVGRPSLSTPTPGFEHRLTSLLAGTAIAAGDACYIKSDGTVGLSLATTTATDATNVVDGYAQGAAATGQSVSLYWGVHMYYATGMTPGTPFYLSGATAGALATTTTSGQTTVMARAIDATRLWVNKSY